MAKKELKVISPQAGYQLKALSSSADILIGGGAAGVGKTWSLLIEPLRHIGNSGFGAVIFRRTSPMIRAEGGLWDASQNIYRNIRGASPKETTLEWKFPSGSKLKFSHLEHESNKFDWQGSEIALIGFDELTHFSKTQFFYLLTRNRSTCGVAPYIRATCNPDPDSWVADFIAWFIEQDDKSPNYGFPIPERQGVLRYFVRDGDSFVWGNSVEEVYQKNKETLDVLLNAAPDTKPKDYIKSMTFIGGSIFDNRELLKVDPGYLGNLNAQDPEEKARLMGGNWKVSRKGADIYDQTKFTDIFTNSFVQSDGRRYITTDIALKGSDKFVVFVWSGKILIDFKIMNKSDGGDVVDQIRKYAFAHNVPESNIVFDNDGVGGFVDGFIKNANEFKNGSKALNNENYVNLKSQCYYKSGDAVGRDEYYVLPEVANRKYDSEMSLRERLVYERKAIKRDKPDDDNKLAVIKKSEMKKFLNGKSPDLMDCFMMREWFEFRENQPSQVRSWSMRENLWSKLDYL